MDLISLRAQVRVLRLNVVYPLPRNLCRKGLAPFCAVSISRVTRLTEILEICSYRSFSILEWPGTASELPSFNLSPSLPCMA
jgi:hypothetical protein